MKLQREAQLWRMVKPLGKAGLYSFGISIGVAILLGSYLFVTSYLVGGW